MIPYADFLYFGVLLYVVIPTVLLGLLGWLGWRWALLMTLGMLVVQYWVPSGLGGLVPRAGALRELWVVLAYGLLCWSVAFVFLRVHPRMPGRGPFWTAIVLTVLPLLVVKVEPLFAPGSPVGFLGISYLTFRALDVVIGIQDDLIKQLPIDRYVTFLLFFPTISSGPIDRYTRFAEDTRRRRTRSEYILDLDGAVHRIFTGFLYKFILAALIKTYWMDPAAAAGGRLMLASYMYAYSLYLFFDFAGYSAFAIGLSYLIGVRSPENFRRPFLARNIRDFWDRWHMSLSYWFRDHIYMRFVYAATRGRWFKSRYRASHVAFFITFGLMGLWHGVQVHYFLYGLYHASLLVGYDVFNRWNARRKLWGSGPGWHAAGIVVTFHAVCFGFLLFSGRLLSY